MQEKLPDNKTNSVFDDLNSTDVDGFNFTSEKERLFSLSFELEHCRWSGIICWFKIVRKIMRLHERVRVVGTIYVMCWLLMSYPSISKVRLYNWPSGKGEKVLFAIDRVSRVNKRTNDSLDFQLVCVSIYEYVISTYVKKLKKIIKFSPGHESFEFRWMGKFFALELRCWWWKMSELTMILLLWDVICGTNVFLLSVILKEMMFFFRRDLHILLYSRLMEYFIL